VEVKISLERPQLFCITVNDIASEPCLPTVPNVSFGLPKKSIGL
jgi:hypothetical protein